MSQQINLFNPIFLKQKKYFSAVTMVQALGIILSGMMVLSAYAAYQSIVLKKEEAAATRQLTLAEMQLTQMTALSTPRQKNKALEESVRKTDAEVKALQLAIDALDKDDFGSKKGYSEYFRAFAHQITPGIWLTGLTIHGAGGELGIQGRAMQPDLVPVYLSRLKHEASMQGKSFATLDMQRPALEKVSADTAAGVTGASKQHSATPYVEFKLVTAGLLSEAQETGTK